MPGPIFQEGVYIGDWLKGEVEIPVKYSRDQIILGNTTGAPVTLITGTVLGKVTATGQFVQFTTGAGDGSQNVAAILGPTSTIPAAGTLNSWAITREATVSDTNITWPAGLTGAPLAAAIVQLAALGIIIRRTV